MAEVNRINDTFKVPKAKDPCYPGSTNAIPEKTFNQIEFNRNKPEDSEFIHEKK